MGNEIPKIQIMGDFAGHRTWFLQHINCKEQRGEGTYRFKKTNCNDIIWIVFGGKMS